MKRNRKQIEDGEDLPGSQTKKAKVVPEIAGTKRKEREDGEDLSGSQAKKAKVALEVAETPSLGTKRKEREDDEHQSGSQPKRSRTNSDSLMVSNIVLHMCGEE